MSENKDTKQKDNRKLYTILGVAVVILMVIIAFALNFSTNKKVDTSDDSLVQTPLPTDTIKPNNTEEPEPAEQIKYEVPKDAASLSYLMELSNDVVIGTSEIVENEEIKQVETKLALDEQSPEISSLIIAGNNDKQMNITRYQIADILYKILLNTNKLPDIYGYQISYEDSEDIPSKYMSAVCCTTYLELLTYDKRFDGYRYVVKDEVDEAFKKLQVYLDNYVPSEITPEEEAKRNEKTPERILLELEAAGILKDRQFKDKLNGQSVALFKEPKTLEQLEANQNSVLEVDLNSINELYDFTKSKLDMEYINLDESLIDYSLLNRAYEDFNVIGVTYLNELDVICSAKEPGLILENKTFEVNQLTSFAGVHGVVGIYNNSIVCEGTKISGDDKFGVMIPYGNRIDSVGLLINKDLFENVLPSNESNYVLAIFGITETSLNELNLAMEVNTGE